MPRVRSILFIGLVFVFVRTRGEDELFNLEDALRDVPTKAPAPKPPLPDFSDEFDLNVALDGEDKYTPTKAPSKPGGSGGSGRQFGDDDLLNAVDDNYKPDETNSKGRSSEGNSGGQSSGGSSGGGGSGTLTGIISGVLLSLAGGVTSYVLYQKKKLCFKMTGNSGEQNMKQDTAQGQHVDPQSYNTLLQSQPANSN